MTHLDLVDLLATHPLTRDLHVVDERVPPAPGRFTPLGTMHHHTASRAHDGRGRYRPAPSLAVVKHGRQDLPGPLCNVLISRVWEHDPSIVTCYAITDGRANDSGRGMRQVLDRVASDLPVATDAPAPGDVNGNPWFYDVEYENDGVGEIYGAAQLDAGARIAAAIHLAHRWSAHRAIHHRQWTARKPDMSWRGDLPAAIAQKMRIPTMLLAYHPRHGVPDALAALAAGAGARRGSQSCDIDEVRAAELALAPLVAVGGPAVDWLAEQLGGPWAVLAGKGVGTHHDGHRVAVRGVDSSDTTIRVLEVLAGR